MFVDPISTKHLLDQRLREVRGAVGRLRRLRAHKNARKARPRWRRS
jgi:hypothetical protein